MPTNDLLDRILAYRDGRLQLTDDAEVYAVVANLPIVRELQNINSQLRNYQAELASVRRFMEGSADSFCAMWAAFKEGTELVNFREVKDGKQR